MCFGHVKTSSGWLGLCPALLYNPLFSDSMKLKLVMTRDVTMLRALFTHEPWRHYALHMYISIFGAHFLGYFHI